MQSSLVALDVLCRQLAIYDIIWGFLRPISSLFSLLAQLKSAEPAYLLPLSQQLLGQSKALEVQHYGYQLLQQLVCLTLPANPPQPSQEQAVKS